MNFTLTNTVALDQDSEPTQSYKSSEAKLHYYAVGIAFVAIILRLVIAHNTKVTGEDAYITLRYAENLAMGNGFIYNPNERVLGTTTPLFTFILALAHLVKLDAMAFGKLLNILSDGVSTYLIARLFAKKQFQRPIPGLFAALVYAVSSTSISVSIGGMETGIVSMLGLMAIYAYIDGKSMPLYVIGAILFLLRIDSLLLIGILFVSLAIRQRKVEGKAVCVFLIIIAPWILFATYYFGSFVPTSVIAKLTVYAEARKSDTLFRNAMWLNHEAFRTQFALGWSQIICSVLFCLGAMKILLCGVDYFKQRSTHPAWQLLFPALCWLLIYFGTMLMSYVPAFPWYFLPPWGLFIIILFIGADWVLVEPISRLLPTQLRRPYLWQTLLVLMFLFGLNHTKRIERNLVQIQKSEDTVRYPLGLWFRQYSEPHDRIFLEPIGYIGYFSQRRVLDMVGLVSPEVLPYYKQEKPLALIVQNLRPEWMCLRREEKNYLQTQLGYSPEKYYDFIRAYPNEDHPVFLIYRLRHPRPIRATVPKMKANPSSIRN